MGSSSTQSTAAKVAMIALVSVLLIGTLYFIHTSAQDGAVAGAPVKRKGKKDEADEEESSPNAPLGGGGAKAASVKPAGKAASAPAPKDEVTAQFEALNKLAVEAFKNNDLEGAVRIFTEAWELGQNHANLANQLRIILYNRSSCYEKLNLVNEALDDCAKVLLRDSKNEKAIRRREKLMKVLEEREDWQGMLTELMVTMMLHFEHSRIQIMLGQPPSDFVPPESLNEVAKKATGVLLAQMEAAGRESPKILPGAFTMHRVLNCLPSYEALKVKVNTQRPIADITEDIKKAATPEETAPLYYERALAQVMENRFKKADEDLQQAAKAVLEGAYTGPQQADILSWAGTFSHLRNDLEKAKTLLDRAAELQPDNPELWVKRGCLCIDRSEIEDAKVMYDKARDLAPDSAYIYIWRAQVHMSATVTEEMLKEAAAELDKCLELDPQNTAALVRLMNVRVQLNDLEGAEQAILKAKKAAPRNGEVVAAYAEMLLIKGQGEEADRELDKAIRLDPTNPQTFMSKGLMAWNLNNHTEAREHLQHAISVDPLFQPAYGFLANLEVKMAPTVEATMEALELIEKGINICRSKDDLEEMLQVKVLTVAKIAAQRRLGLSGRVDF